MFCKNCGSEIKNGLKFCPICGVETLVAAPAPTGYPQNSGMPAPVYQIPTTSGSKWVKFLRVIAWIQFFFNILVGLVLGIAIIAGAVGAAEEMNRYNMMGSSFGGGAIGLAVFVGIFWIIGAAFIAFLVLAICMVVLDAAGDIRGIKDKLNASPVLHESKTVNAHEVNMSASLQEISALLQSLNGTVAALAANEENKG